MAKHSFDPNLAKALGIRPAVVYEFLCVYCNEKARRNADYHDGSFWVRVTYKEFLRIFPYMSEDTLSRSLKKLIAEGLVRVGHYDEYNGIANWYTVN